MKLTPGLLLLMACLTLAFYQPSSITSSKKGLAGQVRVGDFNCGTVPMLGATWMYTWSLDPYVCGNYEAVPMVWGHDQVIALNNRNWAIGGNSQYVLMFNEPDISDQSNMTPTQAAYDYYLVSASLPNKQISSPAPGWAQAWGPGGWMDVWYSEYVRIYGTTPRINFFAVHSYGSSAAEIEYMVTRAVNWAARHNYYNRQYWLTEWGAPYTYDLAGRQMIMSQVMQWLNTQPYVTHYAWFVTQSDSSCGMWYPCGWADLRLVYWDSWTCPGSQWCWFNPTALGVTYMSN